MKLSNVLMLDQQPKEKMPELWSLSSVSLVLLKKSALFKTVLPSKIFESMAMEKPVILGVEGESAELVMSAGGGICIEPESRKGFGHPGTQIVSRSYAAPGTWFEWQALCLGAFRPPGLGETICRCHEARRVGSR